MEQLASNGFNARIAAQFDDVNMNRDGPYGGAHLSQADADILVDRLARSIAESFSQYALPDSPVATAGGNIDNLGPRVTSAEVPANQPNQLLLTVTHDATSGFKALDPDAAAGLGWSLVGANGPVAAATRAAVQDGSHLILTFSSAVPVDGSVSLYYTYGYGRLAAAGAPGGGNAIYDSEGLPIWASSYG
jgi:hypothetical protein